jgi:hypothetical protein
MLDTDLEGLGPKEASEYVLAFITTLKQTEKALDAAQEDAHLWTRRVSLAQSRGDAGLGGAGDGPPVGRHRKAVEAGGGAGRPEGEGLGAQGKAGAHPHGGPQARGR